MIYKFKSIKFIGDYGLKIEMCCAENKDMIAHFLFELSF